MRKVYPRSSAITKFGRRVREERNKRNLSQVTLAVRSGLTPHYLSVIEKATKDIKLSTIEKIAKALGIDISDLMRF